MATVTIEFAGKLVRVSSDSGFNDAARLAKALVLAVEMVQVALPESPKLMELLRIELGREHGP